MKTKSISVEDLGSVVRQIINGALGNNEQMLKFHHVIYEEWYFKKMAELQESKFNYEQAKSPDSEETISATVAHRRIRKYKYKYESSPSSVNIDRTLSAETKDNCKVDKAEYQQNSRSTVDVMCQNKLSVENSRPTDNNSNEQLDINVSDKDVKNDTQIIEIWNNPTQKFRVKSKTETVCNYDVCNDKEKTAVYEGSLIDSVRGIARNDGACNGENCDSPKEQQLRQKLSFESWKRKKTATYRRIFKEERKEKQQALLAKTESMRQKRLIHEARVKQQRENEHSQRLLKKYQEIIKQAKTDAYRDRIESKRVVNENAFNAWKKQKDMKLKEAKKTSQLSENYRERRLKEKLPTSYHAESVDLKFNSWLNQLDWVLHEKYIRERRYLVRSFYCQPVYFGDATLCAK